MTSAGAHRFQRSQYMLVQSPPYPARTPDRVFIPAFTGWDFAARGCAGVLRELRGFSVFIVKDSSVIKQLYITRGGALACPDHQAHVALQHSPPERIRLPATRRALVAVMICLLSKLAFYTIARLSSTVDKGIRRD